MSKIVTTSKGDKRPVQKGRPPMDPSLKRVANSIRLPRWLTDWLNQHKETKTSLIVNALIAHYNLKERENEIKYRYK